MRGESRHLVIAYAARPPIIPLKRRTNYMETSNNAVSYARCFSQYHVGSTWPGTHNSQYEGAQGGPATGHKPVGF
jgi:hypothetical protein